MIYYLITIIIIIFVIYLARNKIIEPLESLAEVISPQPQQDDVEVYLTSNYLNYDKINMDIDKITQQYNELKENIELFKMNVGFIETISQHSDSTLMVGGSFPNNIELNFEFPPPFPGTIGITGDKGDDGNKGVQGPDGPIGVTGGSSYC